MIKLHRLMCEKEFDSISSTNHFAWHKRCKWFTDNPDFLKRVKDGKFNNSKFSQQRYDYLVEYVVESLDDFIRVSNNELMLYRCKSQMVKVKSIHKIGKIS